MDAAQQCRVLSFDVFSHTRRYGSAILRMNMVTNKVFGSRAGRFFFWLRISALAVCVLAFFVTPPLARAVDRSAAVERTLRFSLPLDEAFALANNVSQNPEIEEVYLSGLFSRWSANNPSFRMERDGTGRHWLISIPFPRGRTQYKFVIKMKDRTAPLWIHDFTNPRAVDDGFNGYNSELIIGSWISPAALRIFFGAAAAAIAFYTLLSLLGKILGRFVFSATQRALVIFCLILTVAAVVVTMYSLDAQRGIARQAYLELADMVTLALEGHGYDYSDLESPEAMDRANAAFDSFFMQARLRTSPGGPAGIFTSVAQIVLFTPDLRVVAVADRSEKPLNISLRNAPNFLNYNYGESMFGALVQGMRDEGPTPMEGRYGLSPREHWSSAPAYTASARLLAFNTALIPVVRDLQTICYLGLVINPQVYGSRIAVSLIIYALLFVFLIICCLFLFLYKPTAASVSPELLADFCSRHELTPRETEIIRELVSGRDYQSIADKNFISLKTVKTHIHNIYRKTGVGNRLELTESIRLRK